MNSQDRDLLSRVLGFAAVIAALSIVALMLLTTADVALRSYGQRGIRGNIEISESLLVIGVALGLGQAQLRGAHISMPLLVERLPKPASRIVELVGLLLLTAILGLMIYATSTRALAAYSVGEMRQGLMRIPTWPTRMSVSLGLFLMLLEIVRQGLTHWRTRERSGS